MLPNAKNPTFQLARDGLISLAAMLSCVVALYSITWEAFHTLQAIEKLNHRKDILGSSWNLETKRTIQRELLSQKVYVPLEMMVTTSDIAEFSQSKDATVKAIKMLCPFAKQTDRFVLVPLPFALPFYGTLVFDWCWSPSSSSEK